MDHAKQEKDGYVPIPETYKRRKLNTLYREIPLKDTVSRTLRKYFNAMANLYGTIRLEKAYEIIKSQSPSLVTEDEFLAFVEIARHECEDYYILGEEELLMDGKTEAPLDRAIIAVVLLEGDLERYMQLRKKQKGKPYYVPKKKELLRYADAFYSEETEESSALKHFLSEYARLDETEASALFVDILYETRYMDAGIFETVERLNKCEITFEKDTDFEEFVELYRQFHNTTRLQSNRSYTPDELFEMMPPKDRMLKSVSFDPKIRRSIAAGTLHADELHEDILTMGLPGDELRFYVHGEAANTENDVKQRHKKLKTGRNDPCPCGSGKKYKRCCGR